MDKISKITVQQTLQSLTTGTNSLGKSFEDYTEQHLIPILDPRIDSDLTTLYANAQTLLRNFQMLANSRRGEDQQQTIIAAQNLQLAIETRSDKSAPLEHILSYAECISNTIIDNIIELSDEDDSIQSFVELIKQEFKLLCRYDIIQASEVQTIIESIINNPIANNYERNNGLKLRRLDGTNLTIQQTRDSGIPAIQMFKTVMSVLRNSLSPFNAITPDEASLKIAKSIVAQVILQKVVLAELQRCIRNAIFKDSIVAETLYKYVKDLDVLQNCGASLKAKAINELNGLGFFEADKCYMQANDIKDQDRLNTLFQLIDLLQCHSFFIRPLNKCESLDQDQATQIGYTNCNVVVVFLCDVLLLDVDFIQAATDPDILVDLQGFFIQYVQNSTTVQSCHKGHLKHKDLFRLYDCINELESNPLSTHKFSDIVIIPAIRRTAVVSLLMYKTQGDNCIRQIWESIDKAIESHVPDPDNVKNFALLTTLAPIKCSCSPNSNWFVCQDADELLKFHTCYIGKPAPKPKTGSTDTVTKTECLLANMFCSSTEPVTDGDLNKFQHQIKDVIDDKVLLKIADAAQERVEPFIAKKTPDLERAFIINACRTFYLTAFRSAIVANYVTLLKKQEQYLLDSTKKEQGYTSKLDSCGCGIKYYHTVYHDSRCPLSHKKTAKTLVIRENSTDPANVKYAFSS